MRTVFQVVATMVVANAAVAYGADAKDAAAKIKAGAAATAADAKAKASDVATGAKAQAAETKATVKEAAAEATKKAEAQPAPAAQPATSPMTEAKEMAKEAAVAGAVAAKAVGPSLIIPESAVLPEGVVRARGVVASVKATSGFDRDSKSIDLGATLKATAGAGVLEFGITEKISGQILVPFRSAANFKVDDEAKFRSYVNQSSEYKHQYAQISKQLKENIPLGARAAVLKQGGTEPLADGTAAAVASAIANNTPLGQATPLTSLGFGTIGATEKMGDGIDRLILDRAVSKYRVQNIDTGIGDIELGAKYALSTEKEPWFDGVPFYTSIAAGLRLNSSHYKSAVVAGELPIGRGTTDLGIRLNADYNLLSGAQLQLENQTEFMVAKGKTYKAASVGGIKDFATDKVYATATDVDYERKGMRQVGFAKLVLAPGALVESLNAVKINTKLSYDFDAKTKVDGVEQSDEATKSTSLALGLGFDGLQMGVPVQVDFDYVMPSTGRNVLSAYRSSVGTLKLFYKF